MTDRTTTHIEVQNFLEDIGGASPLAPPGPAELGPNAETAAVDARVRDAQTLVDEIGAEIARIGTVKEQWEAQLNAYGISPQKAVAILDDALLRGISYTRTYNAGSALEVTFAMRPSNCLQRWTTLLANNPDVLTNPLTLNYAQARFYLLESIVRFQGMTYDPRKPDQIANKLDLLPEYAFRRLQQQLSQFDRICELLFSSPEQSMGN